MPSVRFRPLRRRLVSILDRFRLIRPAFRVSEAWTAIRTSGTSVAEVGLLPLPSARLMVRVAGSANHDWFMRSGQSAYEVIAAQVPLQEMHDVFEFGCGCGRIARHWQNFSGSFVGSDLDEPAVRWCRRNLPFARFEVNGLEPPLIFGDESFDLAYAVSVFSHLTAPLQIAWRNELRRVLRPGGVLLVTTQGRSYLPVLKRDEADRFLRGELVVRWEDEAGTNLCQRT
jgi:SAM-dependent methyltransferase